MEENCNLILGNCLKEMNNISDNSVDLIVTSPPYNAKKNYEGYSDNLSIKDWLELIERSLKHSYRVLSPGSRACYNIPWAIGSKPRIFVPHLICAAAENVGFYINNWIIWDKNAAASMACGTWLSPSGPSIRYRSEPIIILQKGIKGKGRISGQGRGHCIPGDCTPKEFLQYTENIWQIQPPRQKNHPAMFPEELPNRLIKLYTWKGDVVLDPFMGSDTTGVAAVKNKRKFIGIELSKKYFAAARTQIKRSSDAV